MRTEETQPVGRGDLHGAETTQPGDEVGRQDGGRGEEVDRLDLRHLGRVMRRWRFLLVAGVLLVVSATVALLRLTTPAFQAETVLVFDQPAILASGQQGLAASQKLINLMPTYAKIATSDPILNEIRDELGVRASLRRLRSRLEATQVPETLAISIRTRDARAQVAEDLATTAADAFVEHVRDLQLDNGVPRENRFVISSLLEPDASRPGRNETRTVVLAGLLGLLVMVGLAFFLEYIEPPRDSETDADYVDRGYVRWAAAA